MGDSEPDNRFERHPWRTGLALTLLALGALELGVRLADPVPVRFARAMRRLHRYSRTSRVDLSPGESVRLRIDRSDRTPLLDFTVITGRDGFRVGDRADDALPRPGAASVRYVHAVGDSYTMGWGVDASSSYPVQLDRLLRPGMRVVNLGVDGFGVLGATTKSLALAPRYPPAAAVLLFVPNDFADDEQAAAVAGRPAAVHVTNELLDLVRRHSALAAVPFALRYRLQFRVGPARRMAADGATVGADPDRLLVPPPGELPAADARRPSLARLVEYRRWLEARGASLLVLVLSTRSESLETLRFCRDEGIRAALVELPAEMRLPDEGHFNALGNRALARLVARLLGPDTAGH